MRPILFAVALAAGCTQSAPSDDPDDVNPDDVVTIHQGVYGILFTSSDIAGQPDVVTPDKPLAVYRIATAAELGGTATSDGDGIYQHELAPGRYELCVNGAEPDAIYEQYLHNCAGPCTFVELDFGQLMRADWGANLSGGWWSAGDHCPRR